MEENWSFSKLYDFRYRYPVIPFFQTILAIAGGATGFNVYTGVGTNSWDDQIDNLHEKPYPDCCPIAHDGGLGSKYSVLQMLNQYLQAYGEEMLSSTTDKPISYGLYAPYAYLAAWNNHEEDWSNLGVAPPRCGYQGLDGFQVNVRSVNYDFGIVNLQTASLDQLGPIPAITLVGGFFMEEQAQMKLVSYVMAGGKLIMLGEVPELDEKFSPCTILKDSLFNHDTGAKLEQVIVDQNGETLATAHILRNLPGEALYTAASQPIAYRINKGNGCAYFVAANLLAKNDPQTSPLFLEILSQITIPAIITEDSQTQVWFYWHGAADVQHIFVLSKSDEAKWHHLLLKNHSGQYEDLKIQLPAKSAAIIRLENQRFSACLAKGINEYENSQVAVAVEYQGVVVLQAEAPGDLLYINDGRQYLQKLFPSTDEAGVA
jgi:beta-galactosidase